MTAARDDDEVRGDGAGQPVTGSGSATGTGAPGRSDEAAGAGASVGAGTPAGREGAGREGAGREGAGREEVDPAAGAASGRSSKPPRSGLMSAVRETVIVVGTALVLSLLIKTFLVQAFYIPSESMERTLLKGDRVLVSQLTPGPFDLERGDVVVFKDPGGWLNDNPQADRGPLAQAAVEVLTFVGILPQDAGEHLIKRLVGLPGDHVVCCDDQGRVSVNGVAVDEPYLAPGAVPSERTFDVEVPEGRIWVMGDNRQNSRDSRWHMDLEGQGTVSEELVVGKAFVTIWPLSRWSRLSTEGDTFDEVPAQEAGSAP